MIWLLELEANVDGKSQTTVETYNNLEIAQQDFKNARKRFDSLQKIQNLKTKIRLVETDEGYHDEKVLESYPI